MRWAELYERDMRQQGSPLSVPGTPGTSQLHPSKGVIEYLGCFRYPRHLSTSSFKGEVESQYLLKDWEKMPYSRTITVVREGQLLSAPGTEGVAPPLSILIVAEIPLL